MVIDAETPKRTPPPAWADIPPETREVVLSQLDKLERKAEDLSRDSRVGGRHLHAERMALLANTIAAAGFALQDVTGEWNDAMEELREYVLLQILQMAFGLRRDAEFPSKLGLELHAGRLRLGSNAFFAAADVLDKGHHDPRVAG